MLFELNLWRVEISFQLETRQLKKNGWNSSHDTRKTMHKAGALTDTINWLKVATFNQFIVSVSAPALSHVRLNCIYWVQVGGGGGVAATPAVQLNSIFSAKTDPRENPEKNLGRSVFKQYNF
jgi:hypothetical protein